jgi:redox-sensitive bicupin YhaK (pirin superfamily)
MQKNIRFVTKGIRADVGEYTIFRIIPNVHVDAVGPFVFFDHAPLIRHEPGEARKAVDGSGAHPHRGIATLTYVMNGVAEHFDSNGNHAQVRSGGAQWMKAGNGVIHDESVNPDPAENDFLTHAMQFWINLPSKQKSERPDYLPLPASDVPEYVLPGQAGMLKVIAGKYGDLVSKIPTYSGQFLYHIHLNVGGSFLVETTAGWECAAFLPLKAAMVNGREIKTGELVLFDKQGTSIDVSATGDGAADIVFFGGEPYTEATVAKGPFVMNTEREIVNAYTDYHLGKYGKIDYTTEAGK